MDLSETAAKARAEAEVRAFCGWHVGPSRTETLTLDGPGGATLLLPSLHVTDLVAITEDGTELEPGSWSYSTAGLVEKARGAYWANAWTRSYRGLEVTLTHGFPEWPLDLVAVVGRLTSRAMDTAGGPSVLSQVGAVSYATGEDGLPATATLTLSDRAILSRYKLPSRL